MCRTAQTLGYSPCETDIPDSYSLLFSSQDPLFRTPFEECIRGLRPLSDIPAKGEKLTELRSRTVLANSETGM